MRLHWPDFTLPPINLWNLPMTTDTNPADEDTDWLMRILPDATDYEIGRFIERVHTLVRNSGYDEQSARNYAFEGVLMQRAGVVEIKL
jgi:hypothetical protein